MNFGNLITSVFFVLLRFAMMKFEQAKKILTRVWKLTVSPSIAWDEIAVEFPTERDLHRQYVFPLIMACVLIEFVCSTLYASAHSLQVGFLQAVITAVALIGGYFASCAACYWYLNRIYPKQYLREDCTKVVSYCFTVVIVLKMMVAIVPSLFFLQILNVFVAYLVWEACRAVFGILEAERGNVVLFFSLFMILFPPILSALTKLLLPNAQI